MWVVSFIVTSPFLLPGNDLYLVITSLMGFLCMCIILFCQIVIFQEIKGHRKCIAAHQVSTENRQKFLKDKKAFQQTTTIFFFLLWAHKSIFGTKTNGVTHESVITGQLGMKKIKQEQQQHCACEQINSESNNSNNIGDNDTNKEIANNTMLQEQH